MCAKPWACSSKSCNTNPFQHVSAPISRHVLLNSPLRNQWGLFQWYISSGNKCHVSSSSLLPLEPFGKVMATCKCLPFGSVRACYFCPEWLWWQGEGFLAWHIAVSAILTAQPPALAPQQHKCSRNSQTGLTDPRSTFMNVVTIRLRAYTFISWSCDWGVICITFLSCLPSMMEFLEMYSVPRLSVIHLCMARPGAAYLQQCIRCTQLWTNPVNQTFHLFSF